MTLNESVDVEAVLNCAEYWNPPDEERSPWLMNRILPAVRRFFDEHRTHGIVYIDEDTVIQEDTLYFNWAKIEA